MSMNIVHYIKTISTLPRGKNVHFRHALPLPENTLCYTCMPPLLQLTAPLAVLNDLMLVKSSCIPPKRHPNR
jgi:hypothetical protein